MPQRYWLGQFMDRSAGTVDNTRRMSLIRKDRYRRDFERAIANTPLRGKQVGARVGETVP
jgi:hypothetical protein